MRLRDTSTRQTANRHPATRILPPYPLAALLRELILLEIVGHGGLILLRQLCGTWWSWRTGGPFAYWDVSRAMLQGDAFWVIVVVCTSAIHLRLLAEWGRWLGGRASFGRWAWLPWLAPGCLLGWLVLIHNDSGAAYILGLRAGIVFEAYHILFFGYVAARIVAVAIQLAVAARLIAHRCRRAVRAEGPWPYLPLGVGLVVGVAVLSAMVYLRIYNAGGSFQAEWGLFARS